MNLVIRENYINKLLAFKDKNIIKVLTGIRRCGKSTIFLMYIDILKKMGVKSENIIHLNLEDLTLREINTYIKLYEYIENKCKNKNEKYYIFVDEVQNINSFEKAIDSLYLNQNYDIYVTGSNAFMLSSEIATFLSGRYIEIKVLPFSYIEYKKYIDLMKQNSNKLFENFSKYGSLPFCVSLEHESEKKDYISSIYDTIVLKDIITRNDLKEPLLLKNLIEFLLDNIGNEISNNSITNFLNSNNNKTNVHMIDSLLSAICSAYLFDIVKRYDVKGKQYLKTQGKYYVVDLGFRYFMLGNKYTDEGRILENIVYFELKRRGYNVCIGKVGDEEIDFIVKNGNECIYIQVASSVKNEETFNREVKPLLSVKDNYSKMLVVNDEVMFGDYNGIKIINIKDFLLADEIK